MTVNGTPTALHRALTPARFHLLVAGPAAGPPVDDALVHRYAGVVDMHRLSRRRAPGAMVDVDGRVHARLGLLGHDAVAQFLVRPDGHIGYRAAGGDLGGVRIYLGHWLIGCEPAAS